MNQRYIFLLYTLIFLSFTSFSQTPIFGDVRVSSSTTADIGSANRTRNVVASNEGILYITYEDINGISVVTSNDRGATFSTPVLLTSNSADPEIAVSSEGIVYVAWVVGNEIRLTRSIDNGNSFDSPRTIYDQMNERTLHINTFENNVYITDNDGDVVLANTNSGLGLFSVFDIVTSDGKTAFVYADIHVDQNGTVYYISDDPDLYLFRSTDNGATFQEILLNPGNESIFFSSYSLSDGPCGTNVFVSGSDELGYLIDLPSGNSTPIMTVSPDQGDSFLPPILISNGDSHNIFRNPSNSDILVVYDENGQIFLQVFDDLLKSIQIEEPTIPFCANEFILPVAFAGNFSSNAIFEVFISDENGDFNNQQLVGSTTDVNATEIMVTLPSGLASSSNYRIKVEVLSDCIQSNLLTIELGNLQFNPIPEQSLCSDASMNTINLNDFTSLIIDNNSQPNTTVAYYTSRTDAENEIDDIESIALNEGVNEVFFRVSLTSDSTCFNISSILFNVMFTEPINESFTICANENFVLPDGTVVTEEGTFSTITTVNGCEQITNFEITVIENETLEEFISICENDSITLPDGTVVNEPGTFAVIGDLNGCEQITIFIVDFNKIDFPSAFSPVNSLGINDTFKALTPDNCPFLFETYNLQIWNRWGELVFETNNSLVGWDGQFNNQLAQNGTYIWHVEYTQGETDFEDSGTVYVIN